MAQKDSDTTTDADLFLALVPRLAELLKGVQQVDLENFSMDIGDLRIFIPRGAFSQPVQPGEKPARRELPADLLPAPFEEKVPSYPGRVREVTLGATRGDGGSRSRTFSIGGAATPAYAGGGGSGPHDPVIALDVFDMDIALPRVLKENVREVMQDPAEWARFNVEKLGADMVTIHLMSTDPLIKIPRRPRP